MICQYKHHDQTGNELGECPKHPDQLVYCEPFYHACEACDPRLFRPCGICGTPVYRCCC